MNLAFPPLEERQSLKRQAEPEILRLIRIPTQHKVAQNDKRVEILPAIL